MNQAIISRVAYQAEYTYFIPMAGTDWQIESGGIHRVYDETGNETSATPYSVRISSETDSLETLQAFLDTHAVLTVTADKTTLTADNSDAVTWSIAGQTVFDYRLLKNNIEVANGTVNDGSLQFKTDEPDTYLVELKIGSQTGYAMVTAEEN